MVENGQKMAEIFLRATYMLNDDIYNNLVFQLFLFSNVQPLYFVRNFKKKKLNTGSKKYPKDKVEKTKNVKNVNIYHI